VLDKRFLKERLCLLQTDFTINPLKTKIMKTNLLSILLTVFFLIGERASAQSWQLVWQDEFNSIGPDWVFETGTGSGGWGNNEMQYYRRENAYTQNGNLIIQARRENFGGMQYTSARMKTQGRKSWKYGRVEARMSMPSFQGVWPAFWMLGENITSVGWPACGEIDIMEHVNTGGAVHGTVHWSDNNNNYASYGSATNTSITAMHTYAIEWNASYIRWFVDGAQFNEVNIQNGINGTGEFHNNFFILLNMAIGGNWPGFAVDNNAFPANMVVEYVRVYQLGSSPTGVVTTYKDCNFGGSAVGLPVGDYNLSQLNARGIANDDISSLRVNSGYEIQVFQHDNFGGSSVTFTGDDACLVDNGINDWVSSVKVRTRSSSFSTTIQAESYSSMSGVQLEGTNDAGGGQNVGWIDTGDWMAYNGINIPSSGSYTVEYRVASGGGGGSLSLDVNGGATVLGSVNVPGTGGWQNWTTVSHTVNINAGTYNFGIYAQAGGWNINWWRITRSGAGARLGEPEVIASSEEIGIYPNPVSSHLNLKLPFSNSGSKIKIISAEGAEVLKGEALGTVNVSGLKAGIYTIIIDHNGKQINKRFIKE